MERVAAAIEGDIPPFRESRNAASGDRVEPGQAFEESPGDASIRLTGEHMRIQGLDLGSVEDDQIGPRHGTAAQ